LLRSVQVKNKQRKPSWLAKHSTGWSGIARQHLKNGTSGKRKLLKGPKEFRDLRRDQRK
jgi:hypothetical protein